MDEVKTKKLSEGTELELLSRQKQILQQQEVLKQEFNSIAQEIDRRINESQKLKANG